MIKSLEETQSIAREVLDNEANALNNLKNFLDEDFYKAIQHIYNSPGRVIITGIGKSAIIANKIVATLNSTGTRAIFMHAADAVHGDIGMVQKDDSVICISKSGNSAEVKVLIPLLQQAGNCMIAMVGNTNSYLAENADYVLNTSIETEACPNNLAPTTSTTAQLAMGDALAVCLINFREFSKKDFAKYHPGGSLGKKLYLRMADLYQQNPKPQVDGDANLKEVIMEITEKRLGATAVTINGQMKGLITDGDLRRMLNDAENINNIRAKDIMSQEPKTINENELAVNALEDLRENKVSQLVVVNDQSEYLGMVHFHDLNREGIL